MDEPTKDTSDVTECLARARAALDELEQCINGEEKAEGEEAPAAAAKEEMMDTEGMPV